MDDGHAWSGSSRRVLVRGYCHAQISQIRAHADDAVVSQPAAHSSGYRAGPEGPDITISNGTPVPHPTRTPVPVKQTPSGCCYQCRGARIRRRMVLSRLRYAARSMICFTLRRSMLRSRAIARWLWPALCRARIVCSSEGAGCTTGGSSCSSVGYGVVRRYVGGPIGVVLMLRPDQQHEEFERADQRQGGPRADQGTYRAVAQAVRQVGTDCRHDAGAEAPRGQSWYTVVPPAGVEHHHGRCPDETVHRERQQPGSHASLAVRADEFIGVLVGDDRGDVGHGQDGERRGDLDESVGSPQLLLERGHVRHEIVADVAGHGSDLHLPVSHSRLTDWWDGTGLGVLNRTPGGP